MQSLDNNNRTEKPYKLAVATTEGTYFFSPAEIIRMEASSNYTCIHFTNRKPMIIARILGEYESVLSGLGFVRTHRSHLVNKRYILFVDQEGTIVMQDTSRAEISRRKRKEVMQELKSSCYRAAMVA